MKPLTIDTKQALTELLESTKKSTLSYFKLSEKELSKTYGEGKWNVRQILHHLADAETVLYDRLRRVISKPNQVIWGFDQDAWNEGLDYHSLPLELNEKVYSSVRDSVINLAQQHYEGSESISFVHSETGLRSLKDEFDKIALHNLHHLNQIEQALV